MSDFAPAARSWKLIAEDICREQDPEKLAALAQELARAMTEQGIGTAKIARLNGVGLS